MKIKKILLTVLLSTHAYAQIPENVVCIQGISGIECTSQDANCRDGYLAKAICYQSAVFRTITGMYVSVSHQGHGTSYRCYHHDDKFWAEQNAKAHLHSFTGMYPLVPRCN